MSVLVQHCAVFRESSTMSLGSTAPRDDGQFKGFTPVNSESHRSGGALAKPDEPVSRAKSAATRPALPSIQSEFPPAHAASKPLPSIHGWRPNEPAPDAESDERVQQESAPLPSKRKRERERDRDRDRDRAPSGDDAARVSWNGIGASPERKPLQASTPSPPANSRLRFAPSDDQAITERPRGKQAPEPRDTIELLPSSRPPAQSETPYARVREVGPRTVSDLAQSVQRHLNGDAVIKEDHTQAMAQAASSLVYEPTDGTKGSMERHHAAGDSEREVPAAEPESLSPKDGSPEVEDAEQHMDADEETAVKKRKRAFTNRTKTGCHTCRARKKKCDEAKPACGNCLRGQFSCAGYGPKPPNPKVQARNAMVPLQPHNPPPHPGPTGYYEGYSANSAQHYSGHWVGRRSTSDGQAHPSQYAPEPHGPPPPLPAPPSIPGPEYRSNSNRESWRPPYGQSEPVPPAFPSERLPPPDYSQIPPPLDSYAQYRASPESWHSGRGQPAYGSNKIGSSGHHGQAGPAPRSQHSTPSAVSAHVNMLTSSSGPTIRKLSQSDLNWTPWKMTLGQSFSLYHDHDIMQDRKNCAESLAAYNKALQPKSNTSSQERERIFNQIIDPSKHPYWSDKKYPGPVGSCGTSTIVEIPFRCDYGYNVHLGDDVVIDNGCHFQDCSEIWIGHRCIVSPNVKFYTLTTSVDPNVRSGSRATFTAGAITVADDVFIGANSVILPFRTIGKGAYVGAGSVVTKDVKPYTVVAGNPAKFIRTIEAGTNVDRHKDPDIQSQNERMAESMRARFQLPPLPRMSGYEPGWKE